VGVEVSSVSWPTGKKHTNVRWDDGRKIDKIIN
jgi:hypothetical protein